MPLYYFHVEDDRTTVDHEGTELPDIEAARHVAICTAGEILRDGAGALLWSEKPWRMWVTDQPGGGGKRFFTLRFSATLD